MKDTLFYILLIMIGFVIGLTVQYLGDHKEETKAKNYTVFSKAKVEYTPRLFILVNDTIAIRKIDSTVWQLDKRKEYYHLSTPH